ncbi:MAG: PASTA domain-containing protein [bacterium]
MKENFLSIIKVLFVVFGIFILIPLQSSAQLQSYFSSYPYYNFSYYNQPFQSISYPIGNFYRQILPIGHGITPYSNVFSNIFSQYAGFPNPSVQSFFSGVPYYNPLLFRPILYPYFSRLPGFFPFFPPTPTPTPPPRTVPDVVSLAQAEAEEDIISRNLRVGNITQEYNTSIEAGYVISQTPEADTTVAINSAVNLVISRGPQMTVALELVANGLSAPVGLASPDDGSGRLFIVDQIGLIKILKPDGEIVSEPFLDIQDKMGVLNEGYDERGLLGLAFHPDYQNNGRFFVYYSAPLRSGAPFGWDHTSNISEFLVDPNDPDKADPDSEEILLRVDQPQSNHNGGQLAFGPDDDYLYISLGDGGAANDRGTGHNPDIGNGQDIINPFWDILGSILRIDVDNGNPYDVPQSNPFVGVTGLNEIFAFGFRNPFRMSFDAEGDHELFVADVGQNLWEEVNIVESGKNYGWNFKEGTHCFNPSNPDVSPSSCPNAGPNGITFTDPIIEYQNSNSQDGLGRAVIGGFVYRGSILPDFYGKYVFGDWSISNQADGTLFLAIPPPKDGVLWPNGEILVANNEDNRPGEFVRGFGQDPNRELYVLTSETTGPSGETGKVYRIVSSSGSIPFINVFDQTVFPSDEVKVAAVGYDGPGWIVIHDPNMNIIGQAPVEEGITLDISIELIRDAEDEEELLAMLHTDTGTIGTFEFPGVDGPVVGDRGIVVERSFTVSHCINPVVPDVIGMTQEEAEDEITSCNLEVGNIELDYSDTVSPGIVIGQSPAPGTTVSAGTSINLLISLGTVSFSGNVQPIFNNVCIGCHRLGGFAGFLSLESGVSYNTLVNVGATRTGTASSIRVIPFNSADSVLYQRVSGIGLPPTEDRMPPGGAPLNPQGQGIIKTWIDEGALNN